jgi:hypothetical protein
MCIRSPKVLVSGVTTWTRELAHAVPERGPFGRLDSLGNSSSTSRMVVTTAVASSFSLVTPDPQGGLVDGPLFVAAPKKANALTDKPARELVGGISGTRQQGDGRLAPDTGAVEEEAYLLESGSQRKRSDRSIRRWPMRVGSPLGLSYGMELQQIR